MSKNLVAILLIILVFGLLFAWWKNGVRAVNSNDKTQKIFVIEKGEGVRVISNKLKKENLIRDSVVFFLLIKKMGLDDKIQAGDFRLSASMSASQIAQTLISGRLDIWFTIPEGKRAEEIADILKTNFTTYDESWRSELVKHEGYLFPDTYLLPKDSSIELIISVMRKNFDKKYAGINFDKPSFFTQTEIVIIASIIEREAKFPQDRELVASVMENRLKIDMALQIDATIQYALGYQQEEKSWWKKQLTAQDLRIDSAYNTYRVAGLPPGPISNPGLASLRAASNPADTNYYYYVSDKEGHSHYAKTREEHDENIKKYGL